MIPLTNHTPTQETILNTLQSNKTILLVSHSPRLTKCSQGVYTPMFFEHSFPPGIPNVFSLQDSRNILHNLPLKISE